MPQNLISLNLTDADVTALHDAFEAIRTTLGSRAVSLTPEQRQSLVKMGDNTRTFCEKAVPALQANTSSMPADFDVAALGQDFADYQKLETLYGEYTEVGELLSDTLKALASDVMTNAILGVGLLKALNKLKPALDTLLQSLSNVRRRKPAPKKRATP